MFKRMGDRKRKRNILGRRETEEDIEKERGERERIQINPGYIFLLLISFNAFFTRNFRFEKINS